MIDLGKLTPAPWHTAGTTYSPSGPKKNLWSNAEPGMQSGQMIAQSISPDDAEFIALSRNAFDVMTRREWFAEPMPRPYKGKWQVRCMGGAEFIGPNQPGPITADGPFTALVEADKWYRENVEAKEQKP